MQLIGHVRRIACHFEIVETLDAVCVKYLRTDSKVRELMSIPVFLGLEGDDSHNAGEVHFRRNLILRMVTVSRVVFHPLILTNNTRIDEVDRRDQVIHELGHLIAMISSGHTDHGNRWIKPTRDLGGTAEIYHKLDLGPLRGK